MPYKNPRSRKAKAAFKRRFANWYRKNRERCLARFKADYWEKKIMSAVRFYLIQELRCPHCKSKLDYERVEEFGSPRIIAVHPPRKKGGQKCPRQGKRFYAPGLDLTEIKL